MRRWWAAPLGALAITIIVPPPSAAAHATFLSSDPADGSVVAEAPQQATLRFSEPVLEGASSARLLTLGNGVETGLEVQVDGTSVHLQLPTLGDGAYVIRFEVVDPSDLHRTTGSVSFGIGVAPPPSEEAAQRNATLLGTVLRTLADGALLVAVGATVLLLALVRATSWQLAARMARVASAAPIVTVVAWAAELVSEAGAAGSRIDWVSVMLSSDPGRRVVIGAQLAVGGALTYRWFGTTTGRGRLSLARILGVLVGALVVVASLGGHSPIGGAAWVGIGLRAVHLAALGAWLGSVAVAWSLTARQRWALERRTVWACTARSAAIGVAVAGASGFVMSGRTVATVTALLSTRYGTAVVVKFVALVLLGALGAWNMRSLVTSELPRRRTVAAELALSVVALVFAAVLAGTAPARGARFDPPVSEPPQVVTGDDADLTISASLDPARPGPNLVTIHVLDRRRPSPGRITDVGLRVLSADGTTVAERRGAPSDGSVEWGDVQLPSAGPLRFEVQIARPDAPVTPFVGQWTAGPVPVTRAPTVLSSRRWWPLAAVAGVAWLLASVAIRWRGGRRAPAKGPVSAA